MKDYKITTTKGTFTGTLLECLEWQAEFQGMFPDIDGVDIGDLKVSFLDDVFREEGDLTPDEAEEIVLERLAS